ncbi:MAG: Ig-like domain-containing protein, partial [Chitinophagaceae bacterium]|nr:Ig-like domain-containing protein [Anaerolineae bacterium]
MRRLLFSCVFLTLLCTLNLVSAQTDALRLINSVPAESGELAPGGRIQLTFNLPLNCGTAAEFVIITPQLRGDWFCDGLLLIFIPAEDATPQTSYTLHINAGLPTLGDLELAETVEVHFYSPGFLRVTEVLPAVDGVNVAANSIITVIFNRPVVPLVIAEDMDGLPQPLTITPTLAGEGEWLNTFVYTYTPSDLLPPGTTYTIAVDSALTTADGVQMPQAFTWSFSTTNPTLTRIKLTDETIYDLQPTVALYFNMPLEQAVIEQNFSLRPVLNRDAALEQVPVPAGAPYAPPVVPNPAAPTPTPRPPIDYGGSIPGTFSWDESGMILFFTPDEALANEMTYQVTLDAEAINAEWETMPLTGETTWQFSTLPFPAVIRTYPADGEATNQYNGFNIEFNTFMNDETITSRLHIDPQPTRFSGYRSNRVYVGQFTAVGSSTYTIRIDAGIEDIYGNVIDEPIEFTFTTLPYPPNFELFIPRGPVGFYSAYHDETALFVRHININRLFMQLYTLDALQFVDLLLNEYQPYAESVYTQPTIYNYVPPENLLLREWHVDVENYQDTTLPSFVTLGTENACDDEPSSELHTGDLVTIQRQTQALDAPIDGAPAMTVYADFQAALVGGAVCTDEAVWWQIEIGNTRAWLPESDESGALLIYAA